MNDQVVMARRTLSWIVGVGTACFIGAMVLILFGESLLPLRTADANVFSESAIGHKAFLETLKRLGVTVLVSRNDTRRRAGFTDLVIVAEPIPDLVSADELEQLMRSERVLLVLPKWRAIPAFGNRRWAGQVGLMPKELVEQILGSVDSGGSIVRLKTAPAWHNDGIAGLPAISEPQLIKSQALKPIIASDAGILVGELSNASPKVWVLSDPDILANHGLGEGDNGLIAVRIIERLMPRGSAVVFDETIHGFRRNPNLALAALEYPFIFVTINVAAALAILLWSASGRFGTPRNPPPPLKAGKTSLIGNAAGLLRFAGHSRELLGRYMEAVIASVAARLHVTAGPDPNETAKWLDRIGANRRLSVGIVPLQQETRIAMAREGIDDGRLLRSARRLHRWKQEMLNGTRGDTGR